MMLDESLWEAFDAVAEREALDVETWLRDADEDELADLRIGLEDELGLSERTAQRYVLYMTGRPGQVRRPSAVALEYMESKTPREWRRPSFVRVTVSAYICVSDDCRSRAVNIPMHGAAAWNFFVALEQYGEEEALRYMFPPEDEDGAPMGIPGAKIYFPRLDGADHGFDVLANYDA